MLAFTDALPAATRMLQHTRLGQQPGRSSSSDNSRRAAAPRPRRLTAVLAADPRHGVTQQQGPGLAQQLGVAAVASVLSLGLALSVPVQPAQATDTVKVGSCLLAKCQKQLAQCLGDPKCLQNIVCLNTCNAAEDEAGCQIRCGDLYGDAAVDTFNACAVSDQKCVPQRQDEGLFPVPPECALDSTFDLSSFQGRWYITAGLNPLFDTFDCQEHYFAVDDAGRLVGKINWRIAKPNGDFIERSTIQMFKQVPEQPALLLNHDNEYLHYQDDWYILASKPDAYVVIYYRGRNDAWDGYGGATVYTKARQLPQELVPEISASVEAAGLRWADFTVTDNSCPPHPPPKTLVQELEDEAVVLEEGIAKEAGVLEEDLESGLKSFGRGFTVLEQQLERELSSEEAAIAAELQRDYRKAAKLLDRVEQQVAKEEAALEGGLAGLGAALKQLFGL